MCIERIEKHEKVKQRYDLSLKNLEAIIVRKKWSSSLRIYVVDRKTPHVLQLTDTPFVVINKEKRIKFEQKIQTYLNIKCRGWGFLNIWLVEFDLVKCFILRNLIKLKANFQMFAFVQDRIQIQIETGHRNSIRIHN